MVLYATGLAINDIVHSEILFSGLNLNQFMRFCNFVGITHMYVSNHILPLPKNVYCSNS